MPDLLSEESFLPVHKVGERLLPVHGPDTIDSEYWPAKWSIDVDGSAFTRRGHIDDKRRLRRQQKKKVRQRRKQHDV